MITETDLELLRYPIGRFNKPTTFSSEEKQIWINRISTFPARLHKGVISLTNEQLDTSYRPDGWTIRQVIHHSADSHMNSFIRFKLALTEDKPTIKPYYEERWAELADSKTMPIEASLELLTVLHYRWVVLLNSLSDEELKKVFIHPEHGTEISLYTNTANYAWHGDHHLAHITGLKERKGW